MFTTFPIDVDHVRLELFFAPQVPTHDKEREQKENRTQSVERRKCQEEGPPRETKGEEKGGKG